MATTLSRGEAVPLDKIRNVAIIAHVDHGKTTLVDTLLRQTLQGTPNLGSMDCNELEMERGITILSKVTRLEWKGHVLNIVDTPGHADFGGEVERVMSMVDGVVLLVDIVQGPRTQTKFVLQKALALPHVQPMVVINKADRTTDRSQDQIETEIFDLFCSLNASEQQLDYTTIYASARDGWAVTEYDHIKDLNRRQNWLDAMLGCYCILDAIVDLIKAPIETRVEQNGDKFSMLVTTVEKVGYATAWSVTTSSSL
ncbi:gtp-binding protein typa/bipa, putative [Perkinsus marinus ATCC 50983]|uniref:Gtp-binding protein typa/bipa, putative n=1 Tax=Perkinsus marinus (strain ATCC 50983 / TXsc) TaxID=423536 RepID=C5KEH8_PERM5|nr:gtp-binding protein typa/bipa, putative [Perkinsus marinus ATCC 50983]EER17116.1 gtp-binding protein typa/bipa, putative [Perkinsus marinus ATCC 50983]|eukprot:XP_002785320.1 gtp-binding protein typa/bipa, putative [Perkinsus marinus ATCC 50983]